MNPALQQYLASVSAAMTMDAGLTPAAPQVMGVQQAPPDLGAMAFGGPPPTAPIGPPAPPEQGAHVPAPSGPIPGLDAALAQGAPAPKPPGQLALPPNLAAAAGPLASSTMALPANDAPVPAAPPANDVNAGVQAPQHPFPLTAAGGSGVIPAHEVDLRGPSLRNAQHDANAAIDMAGRANTANSQATAQDEHAMFLEQERQAQARRVAAEQAMAERDEELQGIAQDFDQSVKALSQMQLDPNRFWASRTTGQKIGAMVSIALGGFVQGARGGSNPGLDMINGAIERDLKAQEFGYHAARDTVQAKQTAFALAMQKYNSVDAARSMARAAAIDGVQAQIGQMSALWKDTNAANHGNTMLAALEEQKMQQIAQGVKFLQPQYVGRQWVDPATGLVYSEKEAKEVATKWRDQDFKREEKGLDVAGQMMVEGTKAGAKAANLQVQLPNGDVIGARNEKEFETLNTLSTAVSTAQQLVTEAKRIRSGTDWRNPYSQDRARLEAIQSELTLAFKDRGGLGALSGPDMDLALGATGDITGQRGTSEAKLDQFMTATNNALRNRVKTIPTAPATAKGQATGAKSLTFHSGGGK